VHIKDGVWDRASQQMRFTFPGEGDGQVRRIVSDLLDTGYDGALSIEPNLRLNQRGDDPSARFDAYVEYGRRFMRLLDESGWRASEAVEPVRKR
jgi:sugar phosphate isomerase/epimerase